MHLFQLWTPRRVRRTVAAVVIVPVLAACGSSPSSTSSAPPSTPAATRSTSAQTTWTVTEAGQKYLAMIKSSNTAISALSKLFGKPLTAANISATAAACSNAANAITTLLHGLAAGNWPAKVQQPVATVMTDASTIRTDFASCAQDGHNGSALNADLQKAVTDGNTEKSASEVLRVDLGLPNN